MTWIRKASLEPAQKEAPQRSLSDPRAQKSKIRTQLDLYKERIHLGYAKTMLDLLKDPVSLGMRGGSRGSQR
jgi:hypothetical protein